MDINDVHREERSEKCDVFFNYVRDENGVAVKEPGHYHYWIPSKWFNDYLESTNVNYPNIPGHDERSVENRWWCDVKDSSKLSLQQACDIIAQTDRYVTHWWGDPKVENSYRDIDTWNELVTYTLRFNLKTDPSPELIQEITEWAERVRVRRPFSRPGYRNEYWDKPGVLHDWTMR